MLALCLLYFSIYYLVAMAYHLFACLFVYCLLVSLIECKFQYGRNIFVFCHWHLQHVKRVSHLIYDSSSIYLLNEWMNEWAFSDYCRDTCIFRADCFLLLNCSKIRTEMALLAFLLFSLIIYYIVLSRFQYQYYT